MPPLPITHEGGWGKESWGGGAWGGAQAPTAGGLSALSVVAIAENVIRFTFNTTPYVSTIGDQFDAADVASHFTVSAVTTTTGYDGRAAQVVTPVSAALAVDYVTGNVLADAVDVVLDRAMSPYPAQYTVTATNLADFSLTLLLSPNPTTQTIFGVLRQLQPPRLDLASPSRDFANPQSLDAVQASTMGPDTSVFLAGATPAQLGTFVADSSGDYAFEEGVAEVRKLVYRIGLTRTGSFLHLPPTWGVGLLDAVKRLGIAAVRDQKAAEYQAQIQQIPEVDRAQVRAFADAANPGIARFQIQVRTRTGSSVSMEVPFDTVAGAVIQGVQV